MIDGCILGVITWLSLVFTFQHLPRTAKYILLKFPLFCDLLATFICFIFLASISQSILSVVGSIVCGLLVNFTLVVYKKINYTESKTNETKN